jgi:hypothetical protein
VNAPNGLYWCSYEIGPVSDEMRELHHFKFYRGSQQLFSMEQAPGSDLYISNAGMIAFMDMSLHFKRELTIHFYSPSGQALFSETFRGASLFGFSDGGDQFAVGTAKQFYVIYLPERRIDSYPPAEQFDISQDGRRVVTAFRGNIRYFDNGALKNEFKTGFTYPRKVKFSGQLGVIATIDKRNLKVYSLSNQDLMFTQKLQGSYSYRDLEIVDDKIITGIHFRENGISRGVLKMFDPGGNTVYETQSATREFETFSHRRPAQSPSTTYPEIPWPFVPFDSMHTVWNYYEQHMGRFDPNDSYLHQGLDIITPIAEPTYAVSEGIVKCVLTIGGASYWRLATSIEQTAAPSRGWLYAHLIESTIQVDVGDSVQLHDYLGDIIEWTTTWGHIHFVEIEDTGLVWQYNDNEWGITYNPLNSLRSNKDSIPPVLENVFPNAKFGFCLNESSVYLNPDNLHGDVDIIAKVVDYVGYSQWQQPAYETYYWVKKLPGGEIVFPRTLGQRLNHSFNFYASTHYQQWAPLIYKRDNTLQPSSWMSMQRNFYHLLTNNNGDTLLDLSETNLAFPTYNYSDGNYRIFVEALDQYGNFTVDSMDVTFLNGVTGISGDDETIPAEYQLMQNYPNPFNPVTHIRFALPEAAPVKIEIFNVLGERVKTLRDAVTPAGYHEVFLDGAQLESGIYFYRLQAGEFRQTRRMLLLK